MSRVALVRCTERVTDDGGHGLDVVCDPGGDENVTAPHFADPGDDSCPLPGDYAALEESAGAGAEQAVGYADVQNAGKAGPGEKRIYARDPTGKPVAALWLKADGSIVAENAGGTLTLTPDGVLSVAGASEAPALAGAVAEAIVQLRAAVNTVAAGLPAPPPVPPFEVPALSPTTVEGAIASKRLKLGG